MSTVTLAAANAFLRFGVSCSSQRDDDWVSGRMTPTWAPPPAAGAELVGAAAAEEEVAAALGGGAALEVAATAGLDDAAAGVDFLLLQPTMPSPATAEIAISLIAVLFMHEPLYWDGRKAWLPCVQLVCGAQHQLLWRTTYARRAARRKGERSQTRVRNGSVTST